MQPAPQRPGHPRRPPASGRHSPSVATAPASKSRQSPRPRASSRTLGPPAASSRASSRSPLLSAMGAANQQNHRLAPTRPPAPAGSSRPGSLPARPGPARPCHRAPGSLQRPGGGDRPTQAGAGPSRALAGHRVLGDAAPRGRTGGPIWARGRPREIGRLRAPVDSAPTGPPASRGQWQQLRREIPRIPARGGGGRALPAPRGLLWAAGPEQRGRPSPPPNSP